MLSRAEALKSFQELPDEFAIDEAIEGLELLEAIRTGVEQADRGKTISLQEMKARIAEWRR